MLNKVITLEALNRALLTLSSDLGFIKAQEQALWLRCDPDAPQNDASRATFKRLNYIRSDRRMVEAKIKKLRDSITFIKRIKL